MINIYYLHINNYIIDYEVVVDRRGGKVVIELLGRINKCQVISPRLDVGVTEYEKSIKNFHQDYLDILFFLQILESLIRKKQEETM